MRPLSSTFSHKKISFYAIAATFKRTRTRTLSPLPPVIFGSALVVSIGLLNRLLGKNSVQNINTEDIAILRKRVEKLAMAAVIEAEQKLDYEPQDVSTCAFINLTFRLGRE